MCGDLCYFSFNADDLRNPAYGYAASEKQVTAAKTVDLAFFYGRNNLLINGDQG